MAGSSFPVNHPLAQKLWSAKLFHEVTANTFWGKFMGTSDRSLIQFKNDTQKDAGDRIRVGLRMLMSGSGVQGDNTLEGNEEALTLYYDDLVIDQLRHATRSSGKMSEQRVPFSVREEGRAALEDWWTERLDTAMANVLTGNSGQTDVRYTGMQAATAPTSANSVSRFIVGGLEGSEASLSASTTHAIRLRDLDRCVALAKTQQPRIRPVRVDGKELYVCFLHPYAIYQIRNNDSSVGGANVPGFYDVHKAMLQGGKISDNPIISGADFIYNGVAVHEWAYLPTSVNATNPTNYRRGVFCGAQAAVFGVGQGGSANKMRWVEEYFDYENQLGIGSSMIYGLKKTVFNSIDYATIALSGYAPTP